MRLLLNIVDEAALIPIVDEAKAAIVLPFSLNIISHSYFMMRDSIHAWSY